ncbi:hypothetical protein C8K36_10262 [Rhodococcus sp. OK519]|uniref:hypothetical protein n=1 Tax=Rhodococcus sp. OK519 TaxID=2135729 RepID=UPI000D3526E0|nr:hypothetical protein C8K36_10262 [Rhodococcus sp. OK519]
MTHDQFGSVRRRHRDPWAARLLRGLSGVVAGGVVVLTAVVLVTAYLASNRDFPGPGAESIATHIAASGVVVGLQVFADRRRGGVAAMAAILILAVTGLLLWTQWWS